jgi:hypothetical protein
VSKFCRTLPDFIAKIGLVVEESDESVFWLNFVTRTALPQSQASEELTKEALELVAIFTAAAKRALSRQPSRRALQR